MAVVLSARSRSIRNKAILILLGVLAAIVIGECIFRVVDFLGYPPDWPQSFAFERVEKEKVDAPKPDFGELPEAPTEYISQAYSALWGFQRRELQYHRRRNPHDIKQRSNRSFRAEAYVQNAAGKHIVYEATYNFDEFGRRRVLNQAGKVTPNRFVLAFGDSFTLGEGLNEGFDYPSILAKILDPSWRVYNFGFHGYSTNDLLDNFEKYQSEFVAGVTEKEGVLIWTFIPDQMTRFYCPWNCYSRSYHWTWPKTEYVEVNGAFESRGPFEKSQSFQRRLFGALSKLSLIQYIGYRFPTRYEQKDYDIFAKSLREAVNRFEIHSGSKVLKTYVVIAMNFDDYPRLRQALQLYDLEPIEYFRVFEVVSMKGATIPLDGHPSSEANWYQSYVLRNRIMTDFVKHKP